MDKGGLAFSKVHNVHQVHQVHVAETGLVSPILSRDFFTTGGSIFFGFHLTAGRSIVTFLRKAETTPYVDGPTRRCGSFAAGDVCEET